LAKELGLKSQELIDRIQTWGLDVKPNALASLDEAMVARIKALETGGGAPAAAVPKPAAPTVAAPSAAAGVPRPTLAAPAPAAPSVSSLSAAPPAARPAGTPGSFATAPAPVQSAGRPPVAASAAMSAPPRPAPAAPAAPVGMQRSHSPGPLAGHGRPGAGPVSRSGAGPLSSHTPHRAGGAGGTAAAPSVSGNEPRPNPVAPPPLRKSDYISPTGTRYPSSAPAAGRRPDSATAGPGEAGRRDSGARPSGGGRPLPPVAAPTTPGAPLRRTDAPRAAGPETKTQRPDIRLTPEQIREMQSRGQLGAGLPGTPGRPAPGARPPGAGPRIGQGAGAPRGGLPGPMNRTVAGSFGGPAPTVAPTVDEEGDAKKGRGAGGRLGSTADRAGRREKRTLRANERHVTSPVPATELLAEGDDEARRGRGPRRQKGGRPVALAPVRRSTAEIELPITIRSLSEEGGIKANDLIRKLMALGQLATINSTLDEETAVLLAAEFGIELRVVHERTAEDELMAALQPDEQDGAVREQRPPVITILGHVDHGKTSLLDRIRKSNVVATESGGITQHIGAYQITHNDKKITFVDTPGHEAFTAMRARGANVTDIVVLVVAADDGVMPQTQEAIAHAKAADVPVVVALNKIDLPNVDSTSNITKIYGELAQQELSPREWGGETELIKTSTVTGRGIDDLLTTLETMAEILELKANPARAASGTCLEASKSEGRGVVATVLVQDGTLKVGDAIVCGDGFGRVRALFDDHGRSILEAGPSTPVEINGLDEVPTAGEAFAVVDDIARARAIAEARRQRSRGASLVDRQAVTLENLFTKLAEQKVKSLNLILKADVQGSLEALLKELEKLENPEVPIRILHKAVGAITESDVLLADASTAIIVGFRVAPEDRAVTLADEKKIDLRRYDIIYQVTDEIKKSVEGMLVPEIKEVHLGRASVRQVFKISKVGTVAGCIVTQGTIERGAKVRIHRDGREIYKGSIEALKRFKDDVKEVALNFECGIKVSNFDDIKVDDAIEAYRVDVIRRTL
jgi:translation initiation factor IF-2